MGYEYDLLFRNFTYGTVQTVQLQLGRDNMMTVRLRRVVARHVERCERALITTRLNSTNHEMFRIPENSANRLDLEELSWVELSCKHVHNFTSHNATQLNS
jgi:hypothetical protein